MGQVVELAVAREARGGAATIGKREVAERYGVTVRTVSRWMARGLPYLKPYEGGAVRFRPVEVEAWMRRHGRG